MTDLVSGPAGAALYGLRMTGLAYGSAGAAL